MSYAHHLSPIGVDMTSHAVRAVQVAGSRHAPRLSACAVIPRAEGRESDVGGDARRLAGVLRRQGFSGVDIVLAVPDDKLLCSVMDLPPRSSGAPIEQLAAAEFARIHRSDPERLELALWDVPSPGAGSRGAAASQYMAVACLHADAEPLLEAFDDAGLTVTALGARSLALVRACGCLLAPSPALNALLHVGWATTSLCIVVDGVLAYERQLESTELAALFRTISDQTGQPPEAIRDAIRTSPDPGDRRAQNSDDARARAIASAHAASLAEQLRVSLSYVNRKYPLLALGPILLTGDCELLPSLPAWIEAAGQAVRVVGAADVLQLPGPRAHPQAPGHGGPGTDGAAPSVGADLLTAIGLARFEEGGHR